ncbi:hypothetical protein, partial [Burkholderia gladioli]|uniref:hypothetical protein n=1 Tax=Burkholderia gladioli TaxID=28095 RepID=UPI001ABA4D36
PTCWAACSAAARSKAANPAAGTSVAGIQAAPWRQESTHGGRQQHAASNEQQAAEIRRPGTYTPTARPTDHKMSSHEE